MAGFKKLRMKRERIVALLMAVLILFSILFIPSKAEAAPGIQTKVGSFTVPSSTGNKAVTGVGFRPKAMLFFANRRASDGTSTTTSQNLEMVMTILGMATSSSARAAIYSNDDYTAGDPRVAGNEVLDVQSANAVSQFSADFTSMDADGFTLNFTNANATAYVVNYMALGGSNLSANITHIVPASVNGSQSTTGVGFRPDAAIFIGGSVFGGSRGMGFASGANNQVTNSSNYDVGLNALGRYQRTDEVYAQITGSVKQVEASLTSFDADGFTLNYTTTDAGNSDIYVLSLKGAKFKAGSFTQKTSTGTQSTTGVGFQPTGLLMSTVQNTASSSIDANQIVQSLGASDGTNQANVVTADNNHGNSSLDRTKLYTALADDATPTVQAAASLSSFDSDGFTMNYTTADATARELFIWRLAQPLSRHQR
ncbi:MAG: hypothetical protein WDN27_03830 [Candidatus Saccharibacteria bacterium]